MLQVGRLRHDPDRVESVNRLGRNCQLMIPSLPIRERGIWPAFDLGLEHFSQQCLQMSLYRSRAFLSQSTSWLLMLRHFHMLSEPCIPGRNPAFSTWRCPLLPLRLLLFWLRKVLGTDAPWKGLGVFVLFFTFSFFKDSLCLCSPLPPPQQFYSDVSRFGFSNSAGSSSGFLNL